MTEATLEKGTGKAMAKSEKARLAKPWTLFDEIDSEFQRLVERTTGLMPRMMTPGLIPLLRTEPAMAGWYPRLDAFEKDDKLMVKVDLPGLKKEDVRVSFKDGDLIIEGERKIEKELKEESYYRAERSYGKFYRRVPVPFDIKADKIKANFTDGVLHVELPIPAESRTKPIEIKIS
ncbi:MAG TPA: Hsp20/alpha crystallin family protein [Thermoanaerobaculia bacterium]|nr:Hsp20/alpha crystallin family protein [Thermoanaerobaculia bacterium]